MRSRNLLLICVGFAAAFFISCSSGGSDEPDTTTELSAQTRVGLSAITKNYDPSEASWRQLLDAAKESGVGLVHIQSPRWSETEIERGTYQFNDFVNFFELNRTYRIPYTLDVATPLGLGTPDVPPDLQFHSFDDPQLLIRYRAFLTAVLERFNEATDVVLHVETVGSYFSGELAPQFMDFCSVINNAVQLAKEIRSGVRVGVYLSADERADIRSCLNRSTDFYAVTYLADRGDSDFRAAFRAIEALPKDKPVALVEAGLPTSSRLGGSEERQIDFVNSLFSLAGSMGDRLTFFSYYHAYDEDPAVTRQYVPSTFPQFDANQQEDLIAFLTTLGLHRTDGTAKPAWNVFKQNVLNRKVMRSAVQ
ncbi:MAG: hypothetical protein U0136_16170 [Bdellovibrionota bacterium]